MEWISGCWPDSLGKPFLKKSERPHVVSIPSDRCVSGGLNDWDIFSERAPPASCTKTWSINIGWVSLPGKIINTHVWWIWQCWLETWRSRESCRRSQCVKPKNTYLSMGFLNPSQHLFSFFFVRSLCLFRIFLFVLNILNERTFLGEKSSRQL